VINIAVVSCKLRITCAVLLSEEKGKREGKEIVLEHTGMWTLTVSINKGRRLLYEKTLVPKPALFL